MRRFIQYCHFSSIFKIKPKNLSIYNQQFIHGTAYISTENKRSSKSKVKVFDKVVGLNRTKIDNYGIKKKEIKKPIGTVFDTEKSVDLKKFDFSKIKLIPVTKTIFEPTPNCTNRSKTEIAKFREGSEITLHGGKIEHPIIEFSDHFYPEYISNYFQEKQFNNPLPIQSYSWPVILSGRDLVGISHTGSGKTLAYIVPLIMHVCQQEPVIPGDGPIAIVMAPTVELCEQLCYITETILENTDIRCLTIHGGASRESQLRSLRKGIEICFATPGRLITLLHSKETDLLRCTFMVIDEGDKMLDCAMDSALLQLTNQCRPDIQTVMFSATWPLSFGPLIRKVLKDNVEIFVGSSELSTNPNIAQFIHVCDWMKINEKIIEVLELILNDGSKEPYKILMFANNAEKANRYKKVISQCKTRFTVGVIHGEKSSAERENVLQRFHKGDVNFLIATDLAARGLDVSDITHVFNVGFPFTCEQYIHRIGRTGRVGKKGIAHTIIYKILKEECERLISHLEEYNHEVNPDLQQFLDVNSPTRKKRFKWQ